MPQTVDFDLKNRPRLRPPPGAPPAEADRGMTKAQKEEFEKANKAREAALAKNKELNDAYHGGPHRAGRQNV